MNYYSQCAYPRVPVVVGASSHGVVAVALLSGFLSAKVFQGIGPQQVTHGAKSRGLLEPIQLHTHAHTHPYTKIHTHTIKDYSTPKSKAYQSAYRAMHIHEHCTLYVHVCASSMKMTLAPIAVQ